MQIIELDRKVTCSGEVIAQYEAGKLSIQLVGSFGNRATLDDLLYSIASYRLSQRLGQKRDNIVFTGGNGTI